jgi:hypothetical protein
VTKVGLCRFAEDGRLKLKLPSSFSLEKSFEGFSLLEKCRRAQIFRNSSRLFQDQSLCSFGGLSSKLRGVGCDKAGHLACKFLSCKRDRKKGALVKKLLRLLFVGSVGLSLAACSSGLQSKGASVQSDVGSNGSMSDDSTQMDVDTKAAEEAAADAEQALAEAEAALSGLMDSDGNLKIFSAGAGSTESEVQAQFLAEKLDQVLDQVIARLQVVPQTFDKARAQLTTLLGKLDANNPAHQAAIDKIMMVMQKLDDTQARVRSLTALVADKIDFVLDKVDALTASLGSNPITALLLFEVEKVKTVILDFKQALLAL